MKILMVAPCYRHGNWQWPPNTTEHSFEYQVTFKELTEFKRGALTIVPFWFDVAMMERGKDAMNKELLETVARERPDFAIFYVGGHEIKKETARKITESGVITLRWCADDSFHFDSVSKKYAPYYSWIVTDHSNCIPKYEALGCHPIHMHESIQPRLYQPVSADQKNIDVSFVGTFNPERGKIIAALWKAGISVFVRGKGWEGGEVGLTEWIDITRRSKIALILNPSPFSVGVKPIVRLFFKRPELGPSMGRIEPDFWNFFSNVREWLQKRNRQVKFRHFETLACRTLGMTLYALDLEKFYELGKEIVVYKNTADLIEKIRYYLVHDAEREAIAAAGYERTMREHTLAKCLERIFKTIGLDV